MLNGTFCGTQNFGWDFSLADYEGDQIPLNWYRLWNMSCLLRLPTPLPSNFKALFSSRNRLHTLNDVIVVLAGETMIGGVGNKNVTSKRDYRYQRLDGEANISCHWQQVSRQSQIIWSPWLRHRPITGRLFQIVLTTRGGSWVQVTAGVLRFVQKIYRVTYVFLCGVSFISFVESQFLVYV